MPNKVTKKRILILEDDPVFLRELEKTLINHERGQCRIDKVLSVDEAMSLLQSAHFDLILVEIKLTGISEPDFLKWIKENQKTPVVLMSGAKDIIDTINFAALGAEGFLEKPLVPEDLFCLLEGCFSLSVDHDYCQLSIDEGVSGTKLKFDMYFRIRDTKFVKISHKGEDLGKDRAHFYKEKNMQHLYVRKEDYIKLVEINLESHSNVAQSKEPSEPKEPFSKASSKRSSERRDIAFIKSITKKTIQNIFNIFKNNEVNQEDSVYARALVMNSVNLLSDDLAVLEILLSLSKQTDFLYAHSVGVSLYSVLIARAMKIQSPPMLFKLAVSGLLHDIGKKAVPAEVLSKKSSELSPSEKEILQRHPTEGVKLLTQLEYIPSEVVLIIHQHHENSLGTGYPSQLAGDKIHPFARIVSLANEFCNLTIKNPNFEEMGPKEAISKILSGTGILSPERFDQETREALKKAFSFPWLLPTEPKSLNGP